MAGFLLNCSGNRSSQANIAQGKNACHWLVPTGAVAVSIAVRNRRACSRVSPHISRFACSPAQTAGRSGLPKMRQRLASSSCMQRTPAGLPCGMPGMGEVIDGAIQQAAQPERQSMAPSVQECAGAGSNQFVAVVAQFHAGDKHLFANAQQGGGGFEVQAATGGQVIDTHVDGAQAGQA